MNDGTLTFAEAMALDPSEVEVAEHGCAVWIKLDKHKYLSLEKLRSSDFRRARPRRSRAQEMAEDVRPGGGDAAYAITLAIRAVCEFIRTKSRGYSDHDAQVAEEVERHFLEPR